MAIKLTPYETDTRLFCVSKFWGDPDMPADMLYPTYRFEDGTQIPLTFICQIDCHDIEALDSEGVLPHEGMLYFFAATDGLFGGEGLSAKGEWPKGAAVVKYTKQINFETFQSQIALDEDGVELSSEPLAIKFGTCADDEFCVRLLGLSPTSPKGRGAAASGDIDDARDAAASGDRGVALENLLLLPFGADCTLQFKLPQSDIRYGNWKRVRAIHY